MISFSDIKYQEEGMLKSLTDDLYSGENKGIGMEETSFNFTGNT